MFLRTKKRKSLRDFSPRQRAVMGMATLVQLGLLAAAQIDLLRRPADQVRGSKWGWRAATLVNFVGPIAYFLLGRRQEYEVKNEPLAEGLA